MATEGIPELTLRRLPQYCHVLRQLRNAGHVTVSASLLAEHLDIHPTQIRKDLAMTGGPGKPKVGHQVGELIARIEAFLHWNNPSEAFLVGAGNLGSALLGVEALKSTGITIVAAFDSNPRRVGKKIHGIPVLPMEKFGDLVRRMHIMVGILAVSEEASQATADLMVQSGIKAIWNFCMSPIAVPDGVLLENVQLLTSLSTLVRKLATLQTRQG